MDTDLHYIIHSKQPLSEEHFKYFLYQVRSASTCWPPASAVQRDRANY